MQTEQFVTVEDMMQAREARAMRQQDLLAAYKAPLCCLTMNIPGPVKAGGWIDAAFEEGVRLAEKLFRSLKTPVLIRERISSFAGSEMYWAVAADAKEVKQAMTAIEEANDLGRLMDLDVIDVSGAKVGREELGLPCRSCLLCGGAAAACARSRAHGYEALVARARDIVNAYFEDKQADHLAALATQSLLAELMVTPKPGLVDRENNGSHDDMDCFTFCASAASLTPYFKSCAKAGMKAPIHTPDDAQPDKPGLEQLFGQLRYLGMQAEEDMLLATGGVNTHKGAIFSMGLLCAAAGCVFASGKTVTAQKLCGLVRDMTGDVLRREMAAINGPCARTAGEQIYAATGLKGARGEAAAGFPSVIHHALPVLDSALSEGAPLNDAGVRALLILMTVVEDTNMIHRGSQARWREVAAQAGALLTASPLSMEAVRELDRQLIREHISPGGSADLLAVTFFLHFLCRHGMNAS